MKKSDSSVSGTTLGTFEIFKNLNVDDRDIIAEKARQLQFQKGQYVISSTSDVRDVFFIVKGEVSVCSFSENGKQVQFDQLHPGMMFGELAAIDGAKRSSDCIAESHLELVAFSSSNFLDIVYDNREVQKAVMERLVGLVRSNMQRVFEFSAFNVAQRVRCEILRLASDGSEIKNGISLNNVPTHAEIATRISSHREAVTRELKLLETAGVITWRPRMHIIHDMNHLMDGIKS